MTSTWHFLSVQDYAEKQQQDQNTPFLAAFFAAFAAAFVAFLA